MKKKRVLILYIKRKKALINIPGTSTICCSAESSNTNSMVMVLSWEKQFVKQELIITLSSIVSFIAMYTLRNTNIDVKN